MALPIHDFQEQLAQSELPADEAFWDNAYRKAFPNLVNHMPCPGDTQSQRMGIDRLILLANGRVLRIDEKKRYVTRDDVLLEYLSNDATGAPGWIEKDLVIDYLAYAFMPSRRVYLFDWCLLRRAWSHYRETWKKQYSIPPAQNKGYRTHSVAVPVDVLTRAIALAAIIEVQP